MMSARRVGIACVLVGVFSAGLVGCASSGPAKTRRSMSSVVPLSAISEQPSAALSSGNTGNCGSLTPGPGQSVGVLYVPDEQEGWTARCFEKTSRSVGSANGGALEGGQLLGVNGPGWIQKGRNGFGTNETIQLLRWAFERVFSRFPYAPPVYVGDLSAEGGGLLPPHSSHQSGRDVDIGYYQPGENPIRRFVEATPENLDVERIWFLLEGLLLTGQVQYVFMDYRIQEILYDHAMNEGWGGSDLKKLFQYPRGLRAPFGRIRHAPGHLNHFHVRFTCSELDRECTTP